MKRTMMMMMMRQKKEEVKGRRHYLDGVNMTVMEGMSVGPRQTVEKTRTHAVVWRGRNMEVSKTRVRKARVRSLGVAVGGARREELTTKQQPAVKTGLHLSSKRRLAKV